MQVIGRAKRKSPRRSAEMTPHTVSFDNNRNLLMNTASSYRRSVVCSPSVGADGSLAAINRNRWRLMSLNTVSGLSSGNPV